MGVAVGAGVSVAVGTGVGVDIGALHAVANSKSAVTARKVDMRVLEKRGVIGAPLRHWMLDTRHSNLDPTVNPTRGREWLSITIHAKVFPHPPYGRTGILRLL